MTEILTSAQMRALEAAAIAAGRVTGAELMERAGKGVRKAAFAAWPPLAKGRHRAAVLCGPGNNGGDGYVIARLLRKRGWRVELAAMGDPARLPPDAAAARARWQKLGDVRALAPDQPLAPLLEGADLVIDALFGIGLGRALAPWLAEGVVGAVAGARAAGARVVAVDVPSGLCADSGRVLVDPDGQGAAISADLTVTFHAPKPGHVLAEGPDHCGSVAVAGLGLEEEAGVAEEAAKPVRLLDDPAPLLPFYVKRGGHKYDHGHALVLSGGPRRGGAARMAARGALRVGAGLVTLGSPSAAMAENAAKLDAIMLREIDEAAALAEALSDRRLSALCVGPGLGTGGREAALVAAALEAGRPLVLDADALTLLAADASGTLGSLVTKLHARAVLTPHGGEFARLFPELAQRLAAPPTQGPAFSKLDAAREAARECGAVVVFKGPDTVIAAPDGRAAISAAAYDRAAPWLATAGAGDVLAGFIAGLLARGAAPMQAAEAACWLHLSCALAFGPGLIAEDLPEQVPAVYRELGL